MSRGEPFAGVWPVPADFDGVVHLTRLNRREVVLNADLIQTVEASPDTVVALTTGEKVLVLESVEEVVQRVIAYKRRIFGPDRELRVGE